MFEPFSKATLAHRALAEVGAYIGVSAFALTVTTAEFSIGFMIVSGVIGIVTWLVRLEGRINTQGELLTRVETQGAHSATAISDVKETVAKIAGHMGVDQ